MLFLGELDLIFTLSSLQVIVVRFWIDFWIESAFFCVQVITMVFWIVLDLISIFICLHATSMAFCCEQAKNSKK